MVAHCLSNASGNQLSELTGITPNHIITWCHTEIDIPRQYTLGLSLNHPNNFIQYHIRLSKSFNHS